MSKIGRIPVVVPEGVKPNKTGSILTITGPLGSVDYPVSNRVEVALEDNKIIVSCSKTDKLSRAMYGTVRALIANIVTGVSQGWLKQLELSGTGFRAETSGSELILTVGFSHPVKITAPAGINFKVEKNIITVSGIDKALVGQVAADIRKVRPPEPYKGKGIAYVGEHIRRKAGKAAKAQGAA